MKKLLAFLMAIALLCTVSMLSACREENGDASSAESSEPPAPPTATEQLAAAFASYGSYLEAIREAFGAELSVLSGEGTTEEVLSLDTFSVAGSSLLGEGPLTLQATTLLRDGTAKCDLQLLCAGDSIPAVLYVAENACYLELPGLLEAPIRLLADEEDAGTSISLTDLQLPELAKKLVETIRDAIGEIYPLEDELTITETEKGKIFSLTVTEEQLNAIAEKLIDLLKETGLAEQLGLSDLLDKNGISFPEDSDPSDGSEDTDVSGDSEVSGSSEGNYLTVELTVEDELPTSLRIVIYEDGVSTDELVLTTSASGNDTVIGMALIVDNETVLSFDCTLTATEGLLEVDAEMSVQNLIITAKITATKESEERLTYNGTVSLNVDMGGMAVTIPFTVAGSTVSNGETYESGVLISASINGMMEFSLSYSNVFTPGETDTITLPTDGIDLDDVDAEALQERLQECYPNAARFFGNLFSGSGDVSGGEQDYGTTYMLDNADVTATLYEDGSIDIYAALNYRMTEDTLILSYDGKDICSLPYSYDRQNGCYQICGEPFWELPNEDAFVYGCQLALGCYSDDSYDAAEFDFIDESNLFVFICLPLTDSGLMLPDGSTLPLDLSISKDGSSLSIGSLELPIYEYTNFDF